jgi:glyoxylase-like metal-dependent hydrolase (beta-lactamase superfamily II)
MQNTSLIHRNATAEHSHPPAHLGGCLCGTVATTFSPAGEWLSPRHVFAQSSGIVDTIIQAAGTAEITVTRLRGGVSVLEGSGGNIAVLSGSEGKLLVDAGIANSCRNIIEALDSLDHAPIGRLINTHWHFDHTDGNEWVNAAGARIIAHENTRTRLLSAQRVEDWHAYFPPPPSGAVPTETFVDDYSLNWNGTTVQLKYYGPAHTDGDISVFFSDFGVFHTGDTWWNGIYPFIDKSTGGTIDGMIQAAENNVLSLTGDMIIIPGHGPVGNRLELIGYRDMLVAIRENIARMKRAGCTLDETIEQKPTAEYDEKWGQFVITPSFFTRLVYDGL